jgi:hypothetical protein
MELDKRINFYLGKNLSNGIIQTYSTEFEGKYKNMHGPYLAQFHNLLTRTNNLDKHFLVIFGDITGEINDITIAKNRWVGNENSVLLRCLNFDRHWGPYYSIADTIPFEEKLDTVFWRGATTGRTTTHPNRFTFIEKWFDRNEAIDVGFSFICQEYEEYSKYVKGEVQPSEFLKHKYIVSLEGNDKDSGLNWKLNSNSLVLMPRPHCCSWLMETTLVPNVHYLLLKDDFSDVEEKLEWCKEHQAECLQIIKQANKFMAQFSDNAAEEALEATVINRYFDILKANRISDTYSLMDIDTCQVIASAHSARPSN